MDLKPSLTPRTVNTELLSKLRLVRQMNSFTSLMVMAPWMAGFELLRDNQPGLWARTQQIGDREVPVEFDLLMAKGLAPKIGKRSV